MEKNKKEEEKKKEEGRREKKENLGMEFMFGTLVWKFLIHV